MERYSVITEKVPREIVLLRGSGCAYKRCVFCDYHTDRSDDIQSNFDLNRSVLSRVTGDCRDLEVINSGSVFELDCGTLNLIKNICLEKNIGTIHFESHYLYRGRITELRREFSEFALKMKLGLETFDYDMREKILHKGIPERDPAVIAEDFDEANLLFGLSGQNTESMRRDIDLGLRHFERICINIMCRNTTRIKPDNAVISEFMNNIYPDVRRSPRIDILINNTDFGVGD